MGKVLEKSGKFKSGDFVSPEKWEPWEPIAFL